ncbi:MAG: EAL domain-containing protein [Gammaproteobacteria bacterium]
MNQTVIATLNEKMQDAFLHDFNEYLIDGKPGQFSGHYRGFNLDSVFQPIVGEDNASVIGYEALLRPSIGRNFPVEAKFMFRYIEETGGLVLFDRICRTLHLLNFLPFSTDQDLLFINVHPAILNQVDLHGKVFESIVHSLSVPTDRVVIELEESFFDDSTILNRAVRNYRERGFKIGISDFGRERTDLKHLWQINPDFVKLHRDILQTAASDEKVERILPKLVDLIQEAGSEVVIQGVETARQLDIAEQAGARYSQGFGLSRPEPASHWLNRKNTCKLSRCA